jgi:putative membrane protein
MISPEPGASDPSPEHAREHAERLVHVLMAYPHALRARLRGEDARESMGGVLPASELSSLDGEDNVPVALLHRMGELLHDARAKGWLNPLLAPTLEASLVSITDVQGGCERIRTTPIPYSYTVFIHRMVAGYCTLLPFGLAATVRWATPLVVLGITYFLFGLDAVGDEVEQPFGHDVNDLPLLALSRTIERDLRRRLGEKSPETLQPVNNVLD